MTEPGPDTPLSRTAASEAVRDLGWRYLLGTLALSVPVRSLAQAGEVASAALTAGGADADGHLRLDLRPDRAELSLQTRALGEVTGRDTQLARRISGAVAGLGLVPAGATSAESPRPVQMLEMAIDALDIPAIRPFWRAVMAYTDEPGRSGPEDAIVDPAGMSSASMAISSICTGRGDSADVAPAGASPSLATAPEMRRASSVSRPVTSPSARVCRDSSARSGRRSRRR